MNQPAAIMGGDQRSRSEPAVRNNPEINFGGVPATVPHHSFMPGLEVVAKV